MASFEVKKIMRLDELVIEYYGDLTMFAEVLKANQKSAVFLNVGDVIELPAKQDIKVEEKLW